MTTNGLCGTPGLWNFLQKRVKTTNQNSRDDRKYRTRG